MLSKFIKCSTKVYVLFCKTILKLMFSNQRHFSGKIICKIENVEVYCSDKAVAFGGINKNVPGAIIAVDSADNPIIVINRRLRDQEPWFIDGVLAHELGHIRKGHHLNNGVFDQKRIEIEADEYALSLGHNMLDILRRYKELYQSGNATKD